jgi:hypothetical protein
VLAHVRVEGVPRQSHENLECGRDDCPFIAAGRLIAMDFRGPGYHWHVVADGLFATPYHARCKPPERPKRRTLCMLRTLPCRLTVVTTSASAECAWVLWTEVHSGSNAGWYVTDAFGDAASCVKAADSLRPIDKHVAKAGGDPTSRKCLPDTVDPRGAKGK